MCRRRYTGAPGSPTYTLPDGTEVPLWTIMPAKEKCEAGSVTCCQGAESERNMGAFDPKVFPNGEMKVTYKIRGLYDGKEYKVIGTPMIDAFVVAGLFDDNRGLPEGTIFKLAPNPIIREVVKTGPRTTPRKDKGMTKAAADKLFGRTPGPRLARRSDQLKKTIQALPGLTPPRDNNT